MEQKRNRSRVELPGGNSFTQPYVVPDNWETNKCSIKVKWYVRFTYYDCINRPNGFAVKWEKAINGYKTLAERQQKAKRVLDEVIKDLRSGLNPITGKTSMILPTIEGEVIRHEFISPSTSFKKVLKWSFDQFEASKTKSDIKSYLYIIYPALAMSKLDKFPIRDISPQHILMLLDACSKVTHRYDVKHKKQVELNWSDYKFNRCIDYLSMLISKVVKLKVIATNPTHGLMKRTTLSKPKVGLKPDQLIAIDEALKAKPDFRRFILIFHSSGSRLTEMLKVKCSDVHLDEHCFYRWILKKKSKKIVQVKTTIPHSVLGLWRAQLAMCTSPDDYLFTRQFRPGRKPLRDSRIINTSWKNLVQVPLKIDVGPYQLKHEYLTALKKLHGSGLAAGHAGHSSTSMVDSIYDLDRDESAHERIKRADIPLAPVKRLQSTEKCRPVAFAIDYI